MTETELELYRHLGDVMFTLPIIFYCLSKINNELKKINETLNMLSIKMERNTL